MTNLPSQVDFLSLSMNGASSLRSAPSDPSAGTDVAPMPFFEDMLADVAQDLAGKDGKKDEQTPPAETGDMNLSMLMISEMLPKPAAQVDSLASQRDSGPNESKDLNAAALSTNDGPSCSVGVTGNLGVALGGGLACAMAGLYAPFTNTSSLPAASSRLLLPMPSLDPGPPPDRPPHRMMAPVNPLQIDEWQGQPSLAKADAADVSATASINAASPEPGRVEPEAANASTADAPAFSLPIHVSRLETHLPAALVQAADQIATPAGQSDPAAAVSSSVALQPQGRLKILTFDLHPAQLGSVTVRMRMSGGHVEITIDVRTEGARSALIKSKDAIVETLTGHGLTLEAPEIRLSTPNAAVESASTASKQNGFSGADSFAQGQGRAHHDDKSAFNHQEWGSAKNSASPRSGVADPDIVSGVYL